MTLYARSDYVSVAVPVSDGGCGQVHTRPVHNGSPDKVWSLNCPPCESFLRRTDIAHDIGNTDPRNGTHHARVVGGWSESLLDVPMTPDEVKIAAKHELDGQKQLAQFGAEFARQMSQAAYEEQRQAAQKNVADDEVAILKHQLATLAAALEQTQQQLNERTPEPLDPPLAEWERELLEKPAPEVPLIPSGGAAFQEATHTCLTCGGPVVRTSNRGPWPKRCASCRETA